MDDRREHFLTMLGDACVAAGVAGIPVELLLRDGRRMSGTPSARMANDGRQPLGETGYSSLLLIDGATAKLDEVVEFVIRTP